MRNPKAPLRDRLPWWAAVEGLGIQFIQGMRLAKEEVERANQKIAERSQQLGIPAMFAPSVDFHWHGRGENAIKRVAMNCAG